MHQKIIELLRDDVVSYHLFLLGDIDGSYLLDRLDDLFFETLKVLAD